MTTKTRALDFSFTLLVGILYAYALASACLAGTYLEYSQLALFGWCAVFTTLFCLVFFNKYTTAACLTGLLLVLLVVYIILYRAQFQVSWFLDLVDYVWEVVLIAEQSLEVPEQYGIVLGRAIAFLFALLTALNLQAGFHFLVLAFLGLATIIYPIYMDWGVSPLAIVLFVFCMVVLLSKKLNLSASDYRRRDRRLNAGYSLAMVPVCGVIVLTAWLLPKPAAAPGGRGVQDFIFRTTNRVVAGITGDTVMSYSADEQPLGGPVSLSNFFVMEVRSDERVYLSGVVRDRYTGSTWTRSDTAVQNLGSDETLYAMAYSSWEFEQQKELMRRLDVSFGTVEVRSGEFETDSIFSPPFRTYVQIDNWDNPVYMDANGALSTVQLLPNGAAYSQLYIAWDWNDPAMVEALRQASGTLPDGTGKYLQLPDSLTQRVYDLAWELAGEYDNPYDQLMAVRDYLREMPYTLFTQEVPGGVDFVDHFLFEEQEGYCVYFATAFAVMGRCLDIPTRYVEGFALSEDRDRDGWQTVSNAQAHAWAEAYFPGIGWVPFEPTPPGYTSGEPMAGLAAVPEEEDGVDGMNLEEFQEMEEELQNQEETSRPEREETSRPENSENEEGAAGGQGGGGIGPGAVVFLVVLAAAGGVAARVYWMRRRFQRERGSARTERAAVLSYGSGILEIAQRMDLHPQPGETLLGFARRVEDSPPFTGELAGIVEVAQVFGKAAFSVDDITAEEVQVLEQFHQKLLVALCATPKGKLSYLLHHYVLGSF